MNPTMHIVWRVLEAAIDVSDQTVTAACRRLIVANRLGWRKHADTARKWADLLSKFSKVRGIIQALDEHSNPTKGTCLRPQRVKVWRVFAAI
jgi:hypothetical protein